MQAAASPSDLRVARLVSVAFALVVLLSMAALAIDIGLLRTAQAQAQDAADSGALAGAGALQLGPGDDVNAAVVAENIAEEHEILGQPVEIVSGEDVRVDPDAGRVTVTARRSSARDNAVRTFFAGILGGDLADVAATATAAIPPPVKASCLKPWAIPDAYDDVNGDGAFDAADRYQPGVTSWGTTHRGADADRGVQLALAQAAQDDAVAPARFTPIDLPLPGGPAGGGDRYRENIAGCNLHVVDAGDSVMPEEDAAAGATQEGVQALLDRDPGAAWDPEQGVVHSSFPPGASPRIARLAVFDPRLPPRPGGRGLVVTGVACFFIESVQGDGRVTGRLFPAGGAASSGSGSPRDTVRLVP